MIADDDGESLDVIELEESLADVEKPAELPAGTYIGEVQDVQVATSNKGNAYYAVKFVVPPDEIPADIQPDFEDGAVLYWNRQIKPRDGKDRRALFNLRKFVEALGLDANTTSIDPNDWMGCQAKLRVRQTINPRDPAAGKRAEISSVEPLEADAAPRGGASKEPDEPEVEEVQTPPARGRGARARR
jgi:hypothetical protein